MGLHGVLDDIADESLTRRGKTVWYRKEEIGLGKALFDSLIMHAGCNEVLKHFFSDKPYYIDLVHWFNHCHMGTCLGQMVDCGTHKMNVLDYNMDLQMMISINKAHFELVSLPFASIMQITGWTHPDTIKQSEKLLWYVSRIFQVTDDYLDMFGDYKYIGRTSVDIQNNKCSWLAVKFMEMATPAQKKELQSCYNTKDPKNHARIKELYMEYELPKIYQQYKAQLLQEASTFAKNATALPPIEAFQSVMEVVAGERF